MSDAYDEPLEINAFGGAVIVAHPRRSTIAAITPQAALASAERIIAAAHLASTHVVDPDDPD